MRKDATKLFERHPDNPLIHPEDYPGLANVRNPAPAQYNDKTVLLVSVWDFRTKTGGETRVAESVDGVNFTLKEEPFIDLVGRAFPYDIVCRHTIDCRMTKVGDIYYILTPVAVKNFSGPCTVLGMTKDFKKYEPLEIITLPQNRGASLFPRKIDGKYFKIDRPGAGTGAPGALWLSSSPDLIHWGEYRPLLHPGYSIWNLTKIGPTPPIETKKGWLVIVHGVQTPCDGAHYYVGAILLDLKDPCRIIGKTYSHLLAPEADYETRGRTDNVVFPCGAIADYGEDTLRLYYGAADTSVCLATASLSGVVEACIQEL